MLPASDEAFLQEKGFNWLVTTEGGMIAVVISSYRLPSGLNQETADLLNLLPGSWPDGTPDMFWVIPEIRKAGGTADPPATGPDQHLGRTWQRFSRHVATWRQGDGLREWMALVQAELEKVAA